MGKKSDTEHINATMNEEVADQSQVPSKETSEKQLKVNEQTAYIEADAFIANPYSLLGRVISIRKKDGKCPESLSDPDFNFEFTLFPISKIKVDEVSKIKKPELRGSIIVNKQLSAKVGFLKYLEGQLDTESFFSIMVYDQAMGLVDVQDENWEPSVEKWIVNNQSLITDPEICYLFVVTGFVQKNVVRKKYVKFKAGAKGGAYGVNISGELSTSTEEYSLDIRFGLTASVIKRPASEIDNSIALVTIPTSKEIELFSSASGSIANVQP